MNHRDNMSRTNYNKLIPDLELTKDDRVRKIETFGDYVGMNKELILMALLPQSVNWD